MGHLLLKPSLRRRLKSVPVSWLMPRPSRNRRLTTHILKLVLPPLIAMHLAVIISTGTLPSPPRRTSLPMSVLRSWKRLLLSRRLLPIGFTPRSVLPNRHPNRLAVITSTVSVQMKLRTWQMPSRVLAYWPRLLHSRSLPLISCILKSVYQLRMPPLVAVTISTVIQLLKLRMRSSPKSVHVCWQKLLLSRSLLLITCIPRLVFPPPMLMHSVVTTSIVSLPPKPRIVSLLMSAPASCLMQWPLRSLPWITCIPRTQLLRLMLMHSVVTTSLVTLLLKLRHPRRKPVLNRENHLRVLLPQ